MYEMNTTKENLQKTIKWIEKRHKIIEIKTIDNYFGYFSHFNITYED